MSQIASLYRVIARQTIRGIEMFGGTVKTLVLAGAVATVSVTSLALPAARCAVATFPATDGRSLPYSEVGAMFRVAHDEFGSFAAELACSYLKKLEVARGPSASVTARAEDNAAKTKPLNRELAAYTAESALSGSKDR